MGIKWAPFNVPISRRLQTALALFWIMSCGLGGPIGYIVLLYMLFCTSAWPLAVVYIFWLYIDRNTSCYGGRRMRWVRQLSCWRYYRDFFPLTLKKTVDLAPDKNYLFCVYPHGLLSAGAFGHFATEATEFSKEFPGLEPYCATLNLHFNSPFLRDYLLSIGAVSASKESIQYILNSPTPGKVLVLIVGGAAEALYAHPESFQIVLKNRRGFIRMALMAGSPLVPVFSFGENDLYDQVSNEPGSKLLKFQNFIKKYSGVSPCIPIGRGILQYSFGPVPRRCPVATVVGAPIDVPKVSNPSQELIDEYHKKFSEAIVDLFEKHKYNYVKEPEDKHLIIV